MTRLMQLRRVETDEPDFLAVDAQRVGVDDTGRSGYNSPGPSDLKQRRSPSKRRQHEEGGNSVTSRHRRKALAKLIVRILRGSREEDINLSKRIIRTVQVPPAPRGFRPLRVYA